MKRSMRLLFVALSALAVFAIAASAASAVEAPYYKVVAKRLGAGEKKEVALAAEGNQVLTNATSKITITCSKVGGEKAFIIGSVVGNAGTSEGKLVYSGCKVEGNGAGCTVEKETITTNQLKDELAYEKKVEPLAAGNKIVDYFTPAEGKVFAKVTFVGASCTFPNTSVEGSVNTEILNSTKAVVAVKQNEAVEAFGFIRAFTGEACKVKESKFEATCAKPSLKAFGTASTLAGVAKVELVSKETFGAFSA